MSKIQPKVLIGPMSSDPAESVSAVNRAFVAGLGDLFKFIIVPIARQHGTTRQSKFNAWNAWYAITQAVGWARRLLRHRPQIAHYAVSSGWAMEKSLFFLALARCTGAKTIGHLHSGGFLTHWAELSVWRRRIALGQLRRLDGFIVLSEWWRERVVQEVGIPPSIVRVVNNPIDPEFEEAALALPVGRAAGRMLSLGTLGRDKGVRELIQACADLRMSGQEFHLEIAGPERDQGIRAEVIATLKQCEMGDHVSLSGGIFGTAKLGIFSETSIFVLASYYENFPLVVLEAAAAGQAIITTPVGAVPEFFEDGVSAMFVQPEDPQQLASAIRLLLENPEMQQALGLEARRVFTERLSRKEIMASLALCYEDILKRFLDSNRLSNPKKIDLSSRSKDTSDTVL